MLIIAVIYRLDQMTQNAKCQAAHWTTHKVGCSALPRGELTPARVEWDEARADEVEKACNLLKPLVAKFMVSSVQPPQL